MQTIIDNHIRDLEKKRDRQDADEQKVHDAMLTAIFKAIFDHSTPGMNMETGSYLSLSPEASQKESGGGCLSSLCAMSESSENCQKMSRFAFSSFFDVAPFPLGLFEGRRFERSGAKTQPQIRVLEGQTPRPFCEASPLKLVETNTNR